MDLKKYIWDVYLYFFAFGKWNLPEPYHYKFSENNNYIAFISASFVTIEPGSPDNSYFVLRGSVFLLNCTVRSGFGQTPNVSWKHNDKWLFDRAKKIDDSTVQLQLLNASAHDNGIYWCGPVSGDKSQGVNISVTVAGNNLF